MTGPTILFDKSFLQSLSVDESVIFDKFFIPVISPVFYMETLADLEKHVRQGRTPELEVEIIAQKTPEMSGVPCPHHIEMCIADLIGKGIPLDGRVPLIGGRAVKVDDRRGVVFEERPEAEAFRRWQLGEFMEVERKYAQQWRRSLYSIDLRAVAAAVKAMGIDPQSCKSIELAKQLADGFLLNSDKPLDRVKFAVLTLGLRPEMELIIAKMWEAAGFSPLTEYAPFAAHVLNVETFFQIALGADLVSSERVSNRTDIAYLFYLPFCMIFVSSDKLHRRIAPHFLRSDQSFVWGPDLKSDLQRLVTRYKALPADELEKGIMKFAHTPPTDGDNLITQLWNHHFGLLRKQGIRDVRVDEERISHLKPFPTEQKELVRALNEFGHAPGLSPDEIDFDTSDPDVLSIERNIHKRKGSFWQVPKHLKDGS